MNTVYFDNSATTAVCPAAIERAADIMKNFYGNPSSTHRLGREAAEIVKNARKTVADHLNCNDQEIYFTSCGTESNNTVIFGAANALKRRGNRVITSVAEHHSVLNSFKSLEKLGFDVTYLPVEKNGSISPDRFADAMVDDVILASFMAVNNETGAVNPIGQLTKIFKKMSPNGIFHCDCVQSFGKMPVDVKALGVDAVSISGHKLHAPKGIGAMYLKKGVKLPPLLYGGGQERELRSGTEAVPFIGALDEAVKYVFSQDLSVKSQRIGQIKEYIIERLTKTKGIYINSPEDASNYVLNISVLGIPSEVMIRFLESNNVFVSGSSACAKGHKSHVLTAMGIESKRIDSSVRISFNAENTLGEAKILCDSIEKACETLVRRI